MLIKNQNANMKKALESKGNSDEANKQALDDL